MQVFDIKKILVPTDFAETAGSALKLAIQIAKMSQAKLILLHVVTPFDITYQKRKSSDKFDHQSLYNRVVRDAENKLKKVTKEIIVECPIKVECIVRVELVIEDVICNIAEKEKADLIVMGTRGTASAGELFAGKNTYLVVHHAGCPVLTIPKEISKQGLKNIILPIRLEVNSRQKVDYAIKIARLFDSTIFITGYSDESGKSKQNKIKQYIVQIEKYLSALNIKHKSAFIFSKNFTKETLDYANKNKADLIVVMKKHDFNLNQLVKGTYSEQFVNHSEIPILSIPVHSNPDMIENFSLLNGDLPY